MFHIFKNYIRKKTRKRSSSIDPDEIFLDAKNLPDFDTNQFEGRLEKPIGRNIFSIFFFIILACGALYLYKVWSLQVVHGDDYKTKSENNRLHNTLIFADRGVIYDRNNNPLVWNTLGASTSEFSLRQYATSTGLSHILGYIKYPTKDSNGFYYQDKYDPRDGLEKIYDSLLSGTDGSKIVETNVKGNVTSESVIQPPKDGTNLTLSIDEDVQKELYTAIVDTAHRANYKGGAGVIMDVHTGEILASVNYPEYSSQTMTDGDDSAKINAWLKDTNNPFLNRVVSGLYTPGSIMKIFIAMGVLDQGVIDPRKQILSTGSISIPNPYDNTKSSTFMDWKAHGLVDLRRAIAVSSNVYFYEVGGGYKDQKGIGISNIEKYVRMFGFGSTTTIAFPGEKAGTIPDPEWKKKNFNGEPWRVGDTYNTAIGQYGFQVTPLQVVRGVSAIANEGTLLVPTFIKGETPKIFGTINLNKNYYTIVKEGMRLGVTDGTSQAINLPFVEVASKTGTAQIGVSKDQINSWVVGFWPYKNPKYAYTIVMERGSKNNQFGAVLVMQEFFKWAEIYGASYLK
ncbi:MAG: penicillin-binding transpeptidase domain-containing protein [bacterium]